MIVARSAEAHHQKIVVVDDAVGAGRRLRLRRRSAGARPSIGRDDPRRIDPWGRPYPPLARRCSWRSTARKRRRCWARWLRARWRRAAGELCSFQPLRPGSTRGRRASGPDFRASRRRHRPDHAELRRRAGGPHEKSRRSTSTRSRRRGGGSISRTGTSPPRRSGRRWGSGAARGRRARDRHPAAARMSEVAGGDDDGGAARAPHAPPARCRPTAPLAV